MRCPFDGDETQGKCSAVVDHFYTVSDVVVVVGCWVLLSGHPTKIRFFYSEIECLVVRLIANMVSVIDIYKVDDYFERDVFWRMKN